ncbi:unnamed protein product [Chrysoparadoxa australica]
MGEACRENVLAMSKLGSFDVIIVCTGDAQQATYWKARLESVQGSVIPSGTKVLAVYEDWSGGAGNALGTLYAWQKAQVQAGDYYNLEAELAAGRISVGLYHTAGKGTRLAPLPASESNNKPGVKLPVAVPTASGSAPLTILEAVIKQTGVYGRSRKGRLSVFWGDQVFIPSVPVASTPSCHADILCTLGPMMDAQEWEAKGMSKYGLIAVNDKGEGAQVEKVNHATAMRLLASLGNVKQVGASLGSFSISAPLLKLLLEEFAAELQAKEGKFDSDPHLWMPLTLELPAYVEIMGQKGTNEAEATKHHSRMRACIKKLWDVTGAKDLGLFGAVDIGGKALWWDYGQLKLYLKNNMLLTGAGEETELLRTFLSVPQQGEEPNQCDLGDAEVDKASVLSRCHLRSGSVTRSVLSGVKCQYVEANECILINVTARRVVAPPGSLIYNVTDTSESGLCLPQAGVMVGLPSERGQSQLLFSSQGIDGGKAWKEKVCGNSASFEDVYLANQKRGADVGEVEAKRIAAGEQAWVHIAS